MNIFCVIIAHNFDTYHVLSTQLCNSSLPLSNIFHSTAMVVSSIVYCFMPFGLHHWLAFLLLFIIPFGASRLPIEWPSTYKRKEKQIWFKRK